MDTMDLASVAGELYGISPAEFVSRRAERVKVARQAGDRSLAGAIGELRKPTKSAWLVNLLARDAAEELHALLDLGLALTEASQRLSGPEIRRLSTERNAAIHRLTRRAVELAADRGESATQTNRQEVSQTLQAALADPAVAQLVRDGVLTKPANYGGFGPTTPVDHHTGTSVEHHTGTSVEPVETTRRQTLISTSSISGTGVEPAEPVETTPTETTSTETTPTETTPTETTSVETTSVEPVETSSTFKVEEAHQKIEEARLAHQQAAKTFATAAARAQEAAALANQLTLQVTELRSQLETVESSEHQARERAQSAGEELQEIQAALAATECSVAEAERSLRSLTGKGSKRPHQ